MSEPFLILHKVRGEPAFDIAEQMPCPICHVDQAEVDFIVPKTEDCDGCNAKGYWWIIPISGHRAFPYWTTNLSELQINMPFDTSWTADWPDHYSANSAPTPTIDLTSLGFIKPQPPVKRRRI